MFVLRFLAVLAFVAMSSAASALTVTFSYENTYFDPATGEETAESDGFSYRFSSTYLTGPFLSFHDDNGILSSRIAPLSGALFTPLSIDLAGNSRMFRSGPDPAPDYFSDFTAWFDWAVSGDVGALPAMTFSGLLNDLEIASLTVGPTAPVPGTFPAPWTTVNFDDSFAGIDSLLLSVGIPGAPLRWFGEEFDTRNMLWCEEWCTEFRVDNLTVRLDPQVAPVPLPASLFLLVGAVAGLGALRLRRRTG